MRTGAGVVMLQGVHPGAPVNDPPRVDPLLLLVVLLLLVLLLLLLLLQVRHILRL